MRSAERLIDAIGGHRKSIVYMSTAFVLAGAGTASAATVDNPIMHAPLAAVPVAAAHDTPLASTARTSSAQPAVIGAGQHSGGALAHPAGLPGHNAARRHVTRRHYRGRGHWLARHGRRSRPPQPVLARLNWQTNPALAARGITPAADRLLPVGTAGPQNVVPISPAQYANAATIVHQALVKRMGVRSAVIAVATAMQESKLLNLDYGTGDSLGLFQQQWDMGWGTPQQIKNPAYAAGKFLDALRVYQAGDPSWASQPMYLAAQGVQRSAFPFAYAQWESQAAQLTASVLHAR